MLPNDTDTLGKVCGVKYHDAFYTYADIMENDIPPPKPIISYGKIIRNNSQLLDLAFIWNKAGDNHQKGIVIPKKAVIEIHVLKTND